MIKVVLKLCNIFLKNGTNSKLFYLIKDGKNKILRLRFLRDLEKWSWILSLRKNGVKMGKNGVKWLTQTPQTYTTAVRDRF